jgi:hypothetical protein
MRRYGSMIGLALLVACHAPAAEAPRQRADPLTYLRGTLVPYPDEHARGLVALTDPVRRRVATYDSALVALVLVRRGAREEAGRVILGLSALQRPDGSLPFSFTLPRPEGSLPYLRSGAVAWVGYAAAEYLDADRGGPARAEAITLARGAARYLMGRQVATPGDPRDGLVRGGAGGFRYELDGKGELRERLEEEDIAWASVEHNIDGFFFFRALARVTGEAQYEDAASRIASALGRAWNGARGQLARGVASTGLDEVPTLDCAAWGSVFLGATGDRDRADTAASVADASFASRDPRTGAHGHRAQRRGPLLEGALLQKVLGPRLPVRDWSELEAIWPEGSAGVALAAWRSGRVARARAIVDALEPLRAADGSMPTSTVEIPFLFDTRPSIAGTAWVELVRFELGRAPEHPTFWAP